MTTILNELANIINQGNSPLTKDKRAKALFSLKPVIARIAEACVPELRNYSYKLIADECLESFHESNSGFHSQFVKVLSTERPLPNDNSMDCDLLFEIHPPGFLRQKWKPQLFNIEIQNDSYALDRCIGRGMLYASGIYYMEYGTIFSYPNYENSWRVHSVWICPAAPLQRRGTVMDFRMTGSCQPNNYRHETLHREYYDKFRMTVINVGGNCGRGRKDLPGFIWTLTTPLLTKEERILKLKEDFDMEVTQALENAADTYNDWIINFLGEERYAEDMQKAETKGKIEGKMEGKMEGIIEGEMKGKIEGKMEGKQEQILCVISNMLSMKYSLDEISKVINMSKADICQIAKDNNLVLP